LGGIDVGAQRGGLASVDVLRLRRRVKCRLGEVVEIAADASGSTKLRDVEAGGGDGEALHFSGCFRGGCGIGHTGVHRAVVEQAHQFSGSRDTCEGGEISTYEQLPVGLKCDGADVSRVSSEGK
jgi:hypothetical protein